MAFRIFRNDALQKYRAQFDLAARYVYLAAKAYDYETNLLSSIPRSGEEFFRSILRQRTIGLIKGGLPEAGTGLADPLAKMDQNFDVIGPQLGFKNPQTETNRFSFRRELLRIKPGTTGNRTWQQALEGYRVEDLRSYDEFIRLCRPPEGWNTNIPQPGLVIPFETNVTSQVNYFGWPLSGGDSYYSSSHFTTKIRTAGLWFSNYNATSDQFGLSTTPRVYLVPAGADVMRDPDSGKAREWFIVDQKLPLPFPISQADLGDKGFIPINVTTPGYANIRRFADFRAYHDSGQFKVEETVTDTRLIGRSVWNTRWLLIIPGANLLANPSNGLDYFINGSGKPGEGVSDILIFFQTYAYSGAKSSE